MTAVVIEYLGMYDAGSRYLELAQERRGIPRAATEKREAARIDPGGI